MSTFEIEQITGPLDHKTFLPMVSLVNKLPDASGEKSAHTDIRDNFQDLIDKENATLFVALERIQVFGSHTVGFAGVEIDNSKAVIRGVAVDERARGHKLGWQLVQEAVQWSSDNGARIVSISPTPERNSQGEELLHDMGFMDVGGELQLQLDDSPLVRP